MRSVAVFRIEPDSGDLIVVGASGEVEGILGGSTVFPRGTGVGGLAVEQRRAVATRDLLHDPRVTISPAHRALIEGATARAVLAVPLLVHDRVLGALALAGRTGRTFREEDRRLAQAVADHVAIAFDNADLYQRLQGRLARLQTVARLTRLSSSSLEMEPVLAEIARSAAELMNATVASLWIADEAGRTLERARFSNTPLAADFPIHTVGFDAGVLGWVATRRQLLDIPDVLADGRLLAPEWWRRHGLTSFLGVPVVLEGRLLAVLALIAPRPFSLDGDDRELLDGFVSQAALAIRTAQLYGEAERWRREAEIVAGLAHTINASLDVHTVLQQMVEAARDLCASDMARIALSEPGSQAAVFRHRIGAHYPDYDRVRLELGQGVAGRVLLTGCPFRTDDSRTDARISQEHLEVVLAEGIVTELSVPIRVAERVEGVINVSNRSARPFNDRDEAILVRLAAHAGVAIQNARLFASEQQARATAEASREALRRETGFVRLLQAVGAAANEARSVEDALRVVLLHVCAHTGWPVGHVHLASGDGDVEIRSTAIWHLADARQFADFQRAMESMRVASATTLPGLVLGSGRPIWISDITRDPAFVGAEAAKAVGLRAGFAFPVLVGTEIAAVLEFFARDALDADDKLLEVATYIGAQVGRVLERQRAAEARRRHEEQLRQLQKIEAVGRLAGGIAHDFNNLLTVITGRTSLLLDRIDDGPLRRDLEQIRSTADRAASLTHQLLAFSRKQVLQPRVLDLNDVVARMASMLRRLIPENIELVLRPGAVGGHVRADLSQIEQVLANLTVNARDAMPQRGRLVIETMNVDLDDDFVRARPGSRPGPHVLLAVNDTGVGFDETVRARLFEPFFTTKEVGKGTGLGLAMVYGIVKQHEGYIEAESAPGAGAAFKIYLPRLAEAVVQQETAAAASPAPRGSGTILLVEDEAAVRDLAEEVLVTNGYTVLAAGTPALALSIAKSHGGPIQLLLTDVVMPQMSGRELAQQLRGVRPEAKVLYMSGYTDDAIVHHGVLDPGTALLQKPFPPVELARRVKEALDAPFTNDGA